LKKPSGKLGRLKKPKEHIAVTTVETSCEEEPE